jgi:hypothetical protein
MVISSDASNGVMERGTMDFCVAVALGNTRSGWCGAGEPVGSRTAVSRCERRQRKFSAALHLAKLSVTFITVSQDFPCREMILKTADSQHLGLSLPFIL